jgi:hypothetical protein
VGVELHCNHCGKLIRAPEGAVGQWGKCPYCLQSVYIPSPADADAGEIPIAPLDEDLARRDREAHEEAAAYLASLDRDKPGRRETPPARGARPADRGRTPAASPGEIIEVPQEVERFVLAMRDSKLDDAERVVGRLRRVRQRAVDYVQALLLDQMPPKIGNLPPALTKGFLKTLSDRLGS